MSEQSPRPVVVAVGHDPLDAALGYAAGEAARAGCGLHLVHVVHPVALGPETALMDSVDFERTGRLALEGALERARDLVPATVPVTSELVWGGVVSSIVDIGATARLIVLQRRPLSRMMRVVTRSVSSGVAARSRVSVVSVPAGWSPIRSSGAVPTVTVGVDVPERSEHLLRVAAQAATGRGASLRVLHTWAFPGAYDDIMISRTEDGEWATRATAEIQATLDRMGDDLVGVRVTIDARHGFAGDALIDAGRTSDLLVVGRHDPLIPIGSHLGPVARAVLREATCPVLLADPVATRHRSGRHDRADTVRARPEDS
jgi:nucleotide-binding universal stress UspA family protein